jgi:hypothetical protein
MVRTVSTPRNRVLIYVSLWLYQQAGFAPALGDGGASRLTRLQFASNEVTSIKAAPV